MIIFFIPYTIDFEDFNVDYDFNILQLTARTDFTSLEYDESVVLNFLATDAFPIDEDAQIRQTTVVKIIDTNRKCNHKRETIIIMFKSYRIGITFGRLRLLHCGRVV